MANSYWALASTVSTMLDSSQSHHNIKYGKSYVQTKSHVWLPITESTQRWWALQAWYWLFSWKTILLDCYQRGTCSYLGAVPAAPMQPCCGVNHGNQTDFCLSILYKVEIVIICFYLFIQGKGKYAWAIQRLDQWALHSVHISSLFLLKVCQFSNMFAQQSE